MISAPSSFPEVLPRPSRVDPGETPSAYNQQLALLNGEQKTRSFEHGNASGCKRFQVKITLWYTLHNSY
jgi:hypothetical protein